MDASPPPHRSSRGALGAAIVAWLAVCALVAVRERSEGAGFVVGTFVGRAAATLALAALGRWLYVRFVRRDRSLVSPWLFVIAAVIAFLALLATVSQEVSERTYDRRACDDPPSAERVFDRPIGRLRFGPADPAVARAFTNGASEQIREQQASVAGREIFEGAQRVGGAVAVVSNVRIDFDDVVAGLRERLPAARELRVAGRRAATARTQRVTALVALRDDCTVVQAFGVDEEDATTFARGLLR